MRHDHRSGRFRILLATLVAGGVFFALWASGSLHRADLVLRDNLVQWTLIQRVQTNLTLVEIDAESLRAVGQWPWPRSIYTEAIRQMDDAGVQSLVLDIDFSARSTPDNDRALATALDRIKDSTGVYLPVFLQRRSHGDQTLLLSQPLPAFRDYVDQVSVNMYPEGDGLVRHLSTGFHWNGTFYPGVWNALATQNDAATWIDFSIDPQSFHYVSFVDLIEGKVPHRFLEGRDVIVGATAIELGDILATPIHRALPGAVIQALGTETLRRGGLYTLNPVPQVLFLVLVWLLSALLFNRTRWHLGLQVIAGFSLLWAGLFIVLYRQAGLMLPIIELPVLTVLVYIAINLAKLDKATLEGFWLQITLRDNQALLDRIVATTNDCILCADPSGSIIRVNHSFLHLCGMDESGLLETPIATRLPDARHGLVTLPDKPFDTHLVDESGRHIPVEATVSRVDLSSSPIFTVVLRDLRERVARENELKYRATYDALTGLFKRSAFFERVNASVGRHDTGCLITLNIDYFHEVNDTYGHAVGDRLLKAVAERLQLEMGEIAHGARVDGNSFALWLPGLRFAAGGEQFCIYLLQALERPFHMNSSETITIQITGTLGVAEYRAPSNTASTTAKGQAGHEDNLAEELLRHAGDAMRLGKQEAVAIRCYSEDDGEAAIKRLKLVPAIRKNIQDDAFQLVYQPKLALPNLVPIGCEALLRWPSNRDEFVPVPTIIEVAENSRQIAPLTQWVVETILKQESAWEAAQRPRNVAVNLSARIFQDAGFVYDLKELLLSGSGYFQFECELTETALLSNKDQALKLIHELVDAGITLAIDDYGTGFSSLSYLQELRANVLKIDRQFVTHIQQHPSNQVIVQSTINMAHELGMHVVAEGVETAEDEAFLREARCDLVQGYHYARPLPLNEFDAWLEQRRSPLAQSQTS
ncbi:EAL domain-containing protein [Marinobacter fonticola]|uniref:EAL domain-containing protein n=1 Tax=Marinobacter fonticola TaxID=2603215 RepID=UPI0011E84312|nr:EAL domain-containing protein [Marinobacter fonticola]